MRSQSFEDQKVLRMRDRLGLRVPGLHAFALRRAVSLDRLKGETPVLAERHRCQSQDQDRLHTWMISTEALRFCELHSSDHNTQNLAKGPEAQIVVPNPEAKAEVGIV